MLEGHIPFARGTRPPPARCRSVSAAAAHVSSRLGNRLTTIRSWNSPRPHRFRPAIRRTEERHGETTIPRFPAMSRAVERRAQSGSIVSRRGLNIDGVEPAGTQQFAIGGAIQRDPARHRQPAQARATGEVAADMQDGPSRHS